MSWTIDTPVRTGSLTCAAIVETELSVRPARYGVSGMGIRRPLLFFLVRGDEVNAIDMNGHFYEAEEIEYLYPNAIARLTSILGEIA